MKNFPKPNVVFIDKVGQEILSREGISSWMNFTYGKFFKLFYKYPIDMVSMYVRHFVSVMTPKFSEFYISNLYSEKGIRVLAILVIWFATICTLLHGIKSKIFDFELAGAVFIIFVPSLLQLLGAVEGRFFIGIHLISYFYTVYYVNYLNYRTIFKDNILSIFVCFILFSFLWIGVLSSVLSSNEIKTLLIDDEPFMCKVTLGKNISFKSGDFSACSRASGLSGNEDWGTWTDGKEVVMDMQIKEGKGKDLLLDLAAVPYLGKTLKEQVVAVFANDHQIAEWHVAQQEVYRAEIPASAMPTDDLNLVFKISDPILLADRNLGIGLYDLRIRNALDNKHTKCKIILGKSISFRSADSSACSKAKGLSVNEPWGTWTDGKEIVMKMHVKKGKKRNLSLKVKAAPYLGENLKEQVVTVLANDQEIAQWHVTQQDVYRAKIPASAMPTDNLKLVFKISDPILLEGRRLGIGLYDMEIRETKNK